MGRAAICLGVIGAASRFRALPIKLRSLIRSSRTEISSRSIRILILIITAVQMGVHVLSRRIPTNHSNSSRVRTTSWLPHKYQRRTVAHTTSIVKDPMHRATTMVRISNESSRRMTKLIVRGVRKWSLNKYTRVTNTGLITTTATSKTSTQTRPKTPLPPSTTASPTPSSPNTNRTNPNPTTTCTRTLLPTPPVSWTTTKTYYSNSSTSCKTITP